MSDRLVTVDGTGKFPNAVLNKLSEFVITRAEFNQLVDSRAIQVINTNSTNTATADKLVKRDASGFFRIKTATAADHPVTKAQLDSRVPETGVPLATELNPGLMSASDKTKLRKMEWVAVDNVSLDTLTESGNYIHPVYGQVVVARVEDFGAVGQTGIFQQTEGLLRNKIGSNPWVVTETLTQNSDLKTDKLKGVVAQANLPNATASVPGMMSAVHYALVQNAVPSILKNGLIKRSSTGAIEVAEPTTDTNPATKKYVDVRTVLATAANDGLLLAADKAKLDGSTTLSTPNTLPWRNGYGNTNFNAVILDAEKPTAPNNATRKDYVDAQVATRAASAHKHDASDVDTGVLDPARLPAASATAQGALSAADKKTIDASTNLATAGALVQRDSAGRAQVVAPSAASDIANKSYVDTQASNASNLTTGTVNPARIANATSVLDGLMAKNDKSKLDGATDNASPSTLVMRDASGNFRTRVILTDVAQSPMINSLTRKDYVDGAIADVLKASVSIPAGTDINGYMAPGFYHQNSSSNALPELNYPVNSAGILEVQTNTGTGLFVYQFYTSYKSAGGRFYRGFWNNVWSDWTRLADVPYVQDLASNASNLTKGTVNPARIANATSALDGLLSKADKALLDGATPAPTANTLVKNDANGRFQTATPSAASDVANKSYVDSRSANASNLTTGTVNPARIANATSAIDGLMSKADKVKLDSADYGPSANAIPMVNASGNFKVPFAYLDEGSVQPTQAHALTRKDYVDGEVAKRVYYGGDLGNTNLNTVTDAGEYYVSSGANASAANNYPYDGAVGVLTVQRFNGVSIWAVQTLIPWSTKTIWVRSTNSATNWSPWIKMASEDYVDSMAKNASNLTTGTVNPARIANATSTLDGLMPKADKSKLDGSTSASTAGQLVQRDSAGRFQVPEPSTNPADVVGRGYVDTRSSNASLLTTGTVNPARIANATSALDGLLAKADKAKLDNSTFNVRASALVQRNGSGTFYVPAPTSSGEVANMDYVDSKSSDASNLSVGVVDPARIVNASSLTDGLMSKADKVKLDEATYSAIPNTLLRRTSVGAVYVAEPSATGHAATKNYVDKQKTLWSGSWFMKGDQTIPLPEAVTQQKTGIILVWSGYENGSLANHSFTYDFVPKAHVENTPGCGVICISTSGNNAGTPSLIVKYVYVSDMRITGNDANGAGIATSRVLRYVIGV